MHLHLDCSRGLSATALLAALHHLGMPSSVLQSVLSRCPLPGSTDIGFRFRPIFADGLRGDEVEISISREHPWYRLSFADVLEPLAQSPETALAAKCVSLLDEASRGTTTDRPDPSVGNTLDVAEFVCSVAVSAALHHMGIKTFTASYIPVPQQHGAIADLDPLCMALLPQLQTRGSSDAGLHFPTPLGIAWLHAVRAVFAPSPAMLVTGIGAGFSNGLDRHRIQLLLGEPTPEMEHSDALFVIETNIDDLSPEITADLIDTCLRTGALDAWLTPILMKKGRPAQLLSALVSEGTREALEAAIFEHSSTLGIRRYPVQRTCLEREIHTVATPWGSVRLKIGRFHGRVVNRAPEYEDCRRISEQHGIPLQRVYTAALSAVV